MPLKQFTTDFQELGKEKSFRYDVDFANFQRGFLVDRHYSFNDLFAFSLKNKVDIEKLDDDFLYAEIGNVSKNGDVEPVKLNFSERKEEEENYYKKIEKGDIIQVQENDILLSKVRPNLRKHVFIDSDTENYFYTSAFIHLEPKKLNKILYYSFRTIFYENLIAISRQGKGYPTLKEDDFYYLKFNKKIIDKLSEKQDKIVAQIEPIEKKIKKLKNQITPPKEVINKVFAREFKFDLKKFEELKKIKNYYLDIATASNNKDIRNSVAFHKESAQFVMDELRRITKSKVKHFIVEPIVLGASISPADFDESGEYYYVSMATVKNYRLELDESQRVSRNYAQENLNKAIQKNDIIMTRSGVAIGKFALVEDDLQGIFADFTMRIRLHNYNPLFAYYYFRTEYFQHLIHSHKKGLQNKNIFPSQIQEFPMIDISLKDQQKIVDEIKTELDAQEQMNRKIEFERNKIDEIIEKAIA